MPHKQSVNPAARFGISTRQTLGCALDAIVVVIMLTWRDGKLPVSLSTLHASPRRAASLRAAAKRRPKLRSVAMAGAVRAGVFRGAGDLGEGAGGKHDS